MAAIRAEHEVGSDRHRPVRPLGPHARDPALHLDEQDAPAAAGESGVRWDTAPVVAGAMLTATAIAFASIALVSTKRRRLAT